MNETTAQLLTALANKLGVATDTIWSALIRQAPVSSAMHLITIAVCLAAAALTLRRLARQNQDIEDMPWSSVLLMFGSIVAVVACLLVLLCGGPTLLSGFTNPEYWAICQLTELLKH